MVSNAQRKHVTALHRKKGRLKQGELLVEGVKSVAELLRSGWEIDQLYALDTWEASEVTCGVIRVSESELAVLSALDSPQEVLAVVKRPPEPEVDLKTGRWLLLDGVQDPGNMGTMLRLADWFGLQGLVASSDSVEWSNPKVIQASMGSVFRVPLVVRDLERLLAATEGIWCAGAFLDGVNLYETTLPENGWLVIGNEGNGIRPEVEALISQRITIPKFGEAESLNAAMAAAVLCSEWRRG
jgi:TrmH family RNA methyltransferase